MISKLSSRISELLCGENIITAEDRELYDYGFYLILSWGMYFLITMSFGFLFRIPWECMLFYSLFSFLRRYAGGFHASKESVCIISTTSSMLLCTALIYLMATLKCVAFPLWMMLFGGGTVLLFSPLDSEEKKLNAAERTYYGRISKWITLSMVVCSLAAMWIGYTGLLYSVSCGLFLESLLLVSGKVRLFLVEWRNTKGKTTSL